MKHIFIIFILITLFFPFVSFFYDISSSSSKTTANTETKTDDNKERVTIQPHDCMTNQDRFYNTGSKSIGVLKYDIDCAPFHNKEILDFTSKSNWSIVSWLGRMMRFFYRLSLVIGIIGLFYSGIQYVRAGGGEAGFSSAKSSLMASLMGFVIGGTAWTIVAMWSKAMSMIT